MPSKSHLRRLTSEERKFWRDAYLVNKGAVLLKGKRLSPEGAAHLAAEHTNADLNEFRIAMGDER